VSPQSTPARARSARHNQASRCPIRSSPGASPRLVGRAAAPRPTFGHAAFRRASHGSSGSGLRLCSTSAGIDGGKGDLAREADGRRRRRRTANRATALSASPAKNGSAPSSEAETDPTPITTARSREALERRARVAARREAPEKEAPRRLTIDTHRQDAGALGPPRYQQVERATMRALAWQPATRRAPPRRRAGARPERSRCEGRQLRASRCRASRHDEQLHAPGRPTSASFSASEPGPT